MITSALDVQGVSPVAGSLRSPAAQADASSDSGGFGAAFSASLSSTSAPEASTPRERAGAASDGSVQTSSVQTSSAQTAAKQRSPLAGGQGDRDLDQADAARTLELQAEESRNASANVLSDTSGKPLTSDQLQLLSSAANSASKGSALEIQASENKAKAAKADELAEALQAGNLPTAGSSPASGSLQPAPAADPSDALKTAATTSATSHTPGAGKGTDGVAKGKGLSHDASTPGVTGSGNLNADTLLAALLPNPGLVPAGPNLPASDAGGSKSRDVSILETSQLSLPIAGEAQSGTGANASGASEAARSDVSRGGLAAAWISAGPGITSARTLGQASSSGNIISQQTHTASSLPASLSAAGVSGAIPSIASTSGETTSLSLKAIADTTGTATHFATALSAAASHAPSQLQTAPSLDQSASSMVHVVSANAHPDAEQSSPATGSTPLGIRPLEANSLAHDSHRGTSGALLSPSQGAPASELRYAIGQPIEIASLVQGSEAKVQSPAGVNVPHAPKLASSQAQPPSLQAGAGSRASSISDVPDAASHKGPDSDDAAGATPGHADAESLIASGIPAAGHDTHGTHGAIPDVAAASSALSAGIGPTLIHLESRSPSGLSSQRGAGALLNSAAQGSGTETVQGAGTLGAAALDGSTTSHAHQTLVATPTSLEVGVQSGTQGWLKIRAQVGEQGGITASLAAASPGGEQMLKGQLPALNAYLHSEQMSVTTSIAERTGLAHSGAAYDASSSASAAGTGAGSGSPGHDTSLFRGGADQGAPQQDTRHAAGTVPSGSIPSVAVLADAGLSSASVDVSGRDDTYTIYPTRADPLRAGQAITPLERSGQRLNVRV